MARPRPKRGRRWRRWTAGVVLLILGLLLLDYYAYPYGAYGGGRGGNTGANGLWLRYTWYFGQHSDADMDTLARQLQERQIRYAYFHVRAIDKEGLLHFHYPESAQRLTARLHRDAPSVKAISWIYVGNKRGEGMVDLANPSVRSHMVKEAVWLAGICGFDGVQWDYEICEDGDPAFLALLRETRAALPPGKLLSVATPLWLPRLLQHWGWSDAYFSQVAAACDQVVVMGYDSGFWLPRSYVWLMRQQVVHVTQDVAHGSRICRVLIGVPTYGAGLRSHNPRAENLRLALKGVRMGLADPEADLATFEGIALFADYTTDARDWQTYRALWR